MSDTHAFRHEKRERLTDQERTKLFLERKGCCHKCTRKIMGGEVWYDEHVIALENGGTNDWSNRALTCKNCFHPKNSEDATIAAKIRAVATVNIVPVCQRQTRGPPMPGSRRSRFKKKMDGTTVLR